MKKPRKEKPLVAAARDITFKPKHTLLETIEQEGLASQYRESADCPKYSACSANVCPLDDDRHLRSHLNGERVCFYLTEAVKDRAPANFAGVRLSALYKVVLPRIPDIISRHRIIARAMLSAAKSAPRMTRFAPRTAP